MKCIRLIGIYKGQPCEVDFAVAQATVESLGGNGSMCLPGEEADIRVEGTRLEVSDVEDKAEPVKGPKPKAKKAVKKAGGFKASTQSG